MITLENISKQYGSKILFDQVSLSFHDKERTGLIGCNGSGKTTILRILSNVESVDKGTIHVPSGLSIGYLPQEVEVLDQMSPLEIVLEPFAHILNFEEKLQSISNTLDPQELQKELKKMDALYDAMHFHDGYSLSSRAEAILAGLGVPQDNWNKPVKHLSGGYRMRTVLGRLLLTSPDFLLLDEPTNHLDMDSLVWLERFLDRYKGGMLIVSHDRDFLNRITTYTAEISGSTILQLKGNYDQFQMLKEELRENELNRAKNLETKIAQTERFVERFKAKATKATQAQSRAKLLEKLKAELPVIIQDGKTIQFSFPDPPMSGNIPLQLSRVTAGYGEKDVFANLSLLINRGDKVAIVGPNGAGKSTLLKLVTGILTPKSGELTIGHNTTVRYFGQHQLEQLDTSKTLYETVRAESVRTETTFVRNILGAFLFSGDSVDKKVEVCSGGEKARLVLATILANPGNLLLLDEPTNHLDIQSIEMLAAAMAEFKGTILFVSHDEYFISQIATRIIEIRPGSVRDFPGTLDDYRSYVEMMFPDEKREATTSSKESPVQKTNDKEKKIFEREQRKKLTRQIEKIEREIVVHENSLAGLRKTIDDPANATNFEQLHTLSRQIVDEEAVLSELMIDWEARQEELSQLEPS
jgi:ATP-binding cassette subfamily F protein 3